MLPMYLIDLGAIITTFVLITKLINDGYISTFWGVIFLSTLIVCIIFARLRGGELSHWVRTIFRVSIPIISLLLLAIIVAGGDTHNTFVVFLFLLYFILILFILYILLFAFSSKEYFHPRMVIFDLILIISATALVLSAILSQVISEEIGVLILLLIIIFNAIGHILKGYPNRLKGNIFRFGLPILSLIFLIFVNKIISIDIIIQLIIIIIFIIIVYKIFSGFLGKK